tara:strand:- start:35 stop:430 length:396 start_codon:yes stop_codon:yes gene_type:complete
MACGANKKEQKSSLLSVTYNAESRGVYLNIELKNAIITIVKDRNGENVETKQLDIEDWKKICLMVEKANARKIKSYKSPSENRFSDKASIANLKMEYKDTTYESNIFDHGNPPRQLKELIEKILALSETAQ